MSVEPLVKVVIEEHVANMVLDNPPLNVISRRLEDDLGTACDLLASRDDVHAVVVTGAGDRAFSAGADINEFPTESSSASLEDQTRASLEHADIVVNKLEALPQPTIAAVRGYALGAGLEIVISCDFRVAGSSAKFGLPEIRLGIFPGTGGLYRLPRLIGEVETKRLAMLGEFITAEQAFTIRLVDEVTADERVLERARELAAQIASQAPAGIQAIKRIIQSERELSHADSMHLTYELAVSVTKSQDAKEGLAAFLAKTQQDPRSKRTSER